MAKKVKAIVKLQLPAGSASPAPPVGPALGQHGVNIMEFVKAFNAQTGDKQGWIIPVVMTVFEDRSFIFITKVPPMSALIKKTLGIESGSGEPNKEKVGKLTDKQITDIATQKLPDLNTDDIEAAKQIVRGTARSMGVEVALS